MHYPAWTNGTIWHVGKSGVRQFIRSRNKCFYGGRGCVQGDTLLNTPSGNIKIKNFRGGDIFSMTENGVDVVCASSPVCYPPEQLYRVKYGTEEIRCTANHRFLTSDGWVKLSQLSVGSTLLQPRESPSIRSRSCCEDDRSRYLEDVRRCFDKLLGYLHHCLSCHCQYDEQLHPCSDTYRDVFQRLVDAFECIRRCSNSDDLGDMCSDIHQKKHDPPSSYISRFVSAVKNFEALENYTCEKSSAPLSVLLTALLRSHEKTSPHEQAHALLKLILSFDTLINLDETLQTAFGSLTSCVLDSSYDLLIFDYAKSLRSSPIESIEKSGKEEFYDLFIPVYNNYVANGTIHHNSSKSWTAAQALIELADAYPMRVLCAREVQKSIAGSSKRLLDDTIKREGLSNRFESTLTEIRNKHTGALFTFSGLRDTDSIKSTEGVDICWVEEANSVTQRSIDDISPTIRKPNSEIWYTLNPRLPDDPAYKMFAVDEPPPGSIVRKINYDENPWFPDVLRTEMEWDKKRDPDKYRHVWLGEPVMHSEAQVFSGKWKIDRVPKPPKDAVFYHGADWGFSVDPTTLIRCWLHGRVLYVDRAVGGVGIEIDKTPELFNQIETASKWEIIADCARPETISYMRNRGFNVVGCRKGAGSVEDGIEFLKSFDIVIDSELKNVIDEFYLYSYKIDKRTDEILPIIMDSNNHYIDALRYAMEKVMNGLTMFDVL